jgi:hypothetical protein
MMKEISEYEKDLATIRSMMEKSGKFISLSGMSGILAGLYALVGAAVVNWLLNHPASSAGPPMAAILAISAIVLIASIVTGLALSGVKARKFGLNLWNATSRQLFTNMAIPLIAGGLFILIMLYHGYYSMAAPACLIFYGLALIQGSANTFDEVRYVGYSDILLGLVAALLPQYGLYIWAAGFGALHIIYGAIMYKKYDR